MSNEVNVEVKSVQEMSLDKMVDIIELHPNRYPKHENSNKGQVHGGECNITRCNRQNAVWWKMDTYGLYCQTCAEDFNIPNKGNICIKVDKKPELKNMEKFKEYNGYYNIKC